MRRMCTIWRREMMAAFLSPVAYVTLLAFMSATAVTFWTACFRNEGRPEPLSILLFGSMMFWLPILVMTVGGYFVSGPYLRAEAAMLDLALEVFVSGC